MVEDHREVGEKVVNENILLKVRVKDYGEGIVVQVVGEEGEGLVRVEDQETKRSALNVTDPQLGSGCRRITLSGA